MPLLRKAGQRAQTEAEKGGMSQWVDGRRASLQAFNARRQTPDAWRPPPSVCKLTCRREADAHGYCLSAVTMMARRKPAGACVRGVKRVVA